MGISGQAGASGEGGGNGGSGGVTKTFATCKEIYDDSIASASPQPVESGTFTLTPPNGVSPFKVYCDMTDGGWTLFASATKNATESAATVMPDSNGYLPQVRFSAIYSNSKMFRARGQSSGTTFFLSKQESTASSCNDMSTGQPETHTDPPNPNTTYSLVWGHNEVANGAACDLSGGNYAFLEVSEDNGGNLLTVEAADGVTLWHSNDPNGPTTFVYSANEAKVELYMK
jgi:hypothetical protein